LANLYGESLVGTDTGPPRGSAGREPWTPQRRSQFLASLGQRARSQYAASLAADESSDVPPYIKRVADAERLVEACEKDAEDADVEWRAARSVAPEFAGDRALSEEQHERWQAACDAQARAVATRTALEQARLRLSRELDSFDRLRLSAEPPPVWAFDDSPGLTKTDRDRR
jgi:hypothetical protein